MTKNPIDSSNIKKLDRMSDELLGKIDKDYRETTKFKGSWVELQKKIDEKRKEYKEDLEKMENFYVQYLGGKINFEEIKKVILDRENKWIQLSNQVSNIIKKKECYQCIRKISLDDIYIYSYKQSKLKKWDLNKVKEFGYELNDFFVVFCSENCFKQSIYFKNNPNKPKKSKNIDEEKVKKWKKNSANDFTCSKCWQEKSGEYLYNSQKNDNKNFCSEACYTQEYGEYCQACTNKCLKFYRDNEVIYCSPCWDKKLKEEAEWESKLDEIYTRYCQYCGDKSGLDFCDKEECVKKEQKRLDNVNNNPYSREREREREQTNLLHYFTTNHIQSITLTNNKLIIKYNHKEEEEEEEEEANTSELQQIKSYLQQQPTKTLTRKELEEKNKKSNNSNYTNAKPSGKTALYVGCGIFIVFALLIIFILARNRQKRKLNR